MVEQVCYSIADEIMIKYSLERCSVMVKIKGDYMNSEIANSIAGYIEILNQVNRNLIKACGYDAYIDINGMLRNRVLDIVQEIPRLTPYKFDDQKQHQVIHKGYGLMEYQKEIPYLKSEYENILKANYDFLDKIRKIRNKYEHQMHKNRPSSSGSGTLILFDIEFDVNNELIKVSAGGFVKLIKGLNILFARLVDDIKTYAFQNDKSDYYFYREITKTNFLDFNDIYKSELLRKIGTIMSEC